MTEVVGVRFKEGGKIYYFSPGGANLKSGDQVIVETSKGLEFGIVAKKNSEVEDDKVIKPLKRVVRIANSSDIKTVKDNREQEKKMFGICEEKIAKYGLEMKLVSVEYAFDGSKVLFCFTSDNRVDFRELVKDLASTFHTRIELRQIGVRDETKMKGGLGMCGRPLCCELYLGDFQPVSIKMAKEQGLSLNPAKISGNCGRLMCCLKYEQDSYEHLLSVTPKVGAIVDTAEGKGRVIEVNLLKGTLKVMLDRFPDAAPRIYDRHDIKLIKDGSIKMSKEELAALKGMEK